MFRERVTSDLTTSPKSVEKSLARDLLEGTKKSLALKTLLFLSTSFLPSFQREEKSQISPAHQNPRTFPNPPMATAAASASASAMVSLIALGLLFFASPASACYTRLFAFGDSLTDTGNFLHSIGDQTDDPVAQLPYGQTFFGRPTGRFSDGRVIVDFVAEAFGLPYTMPYLAGSTAEDFKYGANFAVGGATALNNDYFRKRDVDPNWTEHSLDEQIRWFKQLLRLLSSQKEQEELMRNSLFFVGEIGGNDYNHLFIRKKTLDEVRAIVPDVADAIGAAAKELIQLGAKTLVVPGNFPIGCVPLYLVVYHSENEEYYDPKTGCINWLNEFAEFHNGMIINKINSLRQSYPNVTIIYADYYETSMNIFRSPLQFGFEVPLNACCGSDAPYNCTPSILCGTPGSSVCKDPSAYTSWDGLHLTEASYKLVAEGILEGPYASPPLIKTCTNFKRKTGTVKLPFSDPFSSI